LGFRLRMKTVFKMKIWRLEVLLAFWGLSILGPYLLGVPCSPYFLALPVLTSLIARIRNTKELLCILGSIARIRNTKVCEEV